MASSIKSYIKSVNKVYFLFFVLGVLIGMLFYFKTEDTYEKNLFVALAQDVYRALPEGTNDEQMVLLTSMRVVHDAIQSRHKFFNNIGGFKAGVLQPVTVDLMTGQGACGSYAMVFARLMENLNYEVRMAQMLANGVYGGHIIVEVKLKEGWVVLDPLYDLYFTKPDGSLASFKNVQTDWDYYKEQVPEGYDLSYRYEDVRYTNWNKIPLVMPAFKKVLNLFMGTERANEVSIRIIMMRKFNVFFIITLALTFLVAGYTLLLIRRNATKLKAQLLSTNVSLDKNKAKGSVTLMKPVTTTSGHTLSSPTSTNNRGPIKAN